MKQNIKKHLPSVRLNDEEYKKGMESQKNQPISGENHLQPTIFKMPLLLTVIGASRCSACARRVPLNSNMD